MHLFTVCLMLGGLTIVSSFSFSFLRQGSFLSTSSKLVSNSRQFRAGRSINMSASDTVSKSIAASDIMIFSKSYCPYCDKAKAALTKLNLKFSVLELDTMGPAGAEIQAELQKVSGQRTVPNVYIKGKHLGGCDDTLKAISTGELQKMLA